jgi:hypothetical protein
MLLNDKALRGAIAAIDMKLDCGHKKMREMRYLVILWRYYG